MSPAPDAQEAGQKGARRWLRPAAVAAVVLACIAAAVGVLRGREPPAEAAMPDPPRSAPAPATRPGPAPAAAPVAAAPGGALKPPAVDQPPTPAPRGAAVHARAGAAPGRAKAASPLLLRDSRAETAPPAALPKGWLQLAISPWGEVEIDGKPAGTTPPLTRVSLDEGAHTVTVRNDDFPPYTTSVQVGSDKPVVVRHRFGQ
jgi:serine/threonine-protein kinase